MFCSASRRAGQSIAAGEWPRSVAASALAPGTPYGRGHWCRCGVARSCQSMGSARVVVRSRRLAMNSAWGAAAVGEAELPRFCGGPVVVVDGLIHGIGVDLATAVAVDRCADVAEQSAELRVVVGADPFMRGAVRLSWPRCDGTVLRPGRPGQGLTSGTDCGTPGGKCRGRSAALRSNPACRHDPPSGLVTLGSRPPWAAAQPGGHDEQIS
jgi:hypothetical protein